MEPLSNDHDLRDAVVKELQDDPEVLSTHISVTAVDGAITLGGHVEAYHQKHEAVRAAERVAGVRAVADDIEVREPSLHDRGDDEIAEEIAHERGKRSDSPDSVQVQVSDGHVFLRGEIESESHRDEIEAIARRLTGVRAVTNLIEVKAPAESGAEAL